MFKALFFLIIWNITHLTFIKYSIMLHIMVVKDFHFLKYSIMLHIMVIKDSHFIIYVTSYVLIFFAYLKYTTSHQTRNLTSWRLIAFLIDTFKPKSSSSLATQQIDFAVCIEHKSRKHRSPSALELVLMESIAWRPPSPIL